MIHSHLIFPAELSAPLNACKALSVWGGMPMRGYARVRQSIHVGVCQGIVHHDVYGISAKCYLFGGVPIQGHTNRGIEYGVQTYLETGVYHGSVVF